MRALQEKIKRIEIEKNNLDQQSVYYDTWFYLGGEFRTVPQWE